MCSKNHSIINDFHFAHSCAMKMLAGFLLPGGMVAVSQEAFDILAQNTAFSKNTPTHNMEFSSAFYVKFEE